MTLNLERRNCYHRRRGRRKRRGRMRRGMKMMMRRGRRIRRIQNHNQDSVPYTSTFLCLVYFHKS
jgi:hypothetical protein